MRDARALQHNCVHLRRTAQVLSRNPIPVQAGCVTGTTQGIADRFGAFGPVTESHHCRDVRCVLALSSGCWAVPQYQAHHSRVSTCVHSLSNSAGSSLSLCLTTSSMSEAWIRLMICIVLVSEDVHTQGHFQHHLFLPSFTSTMGPQRLQRHHRERSPLLQRLHSPALSPALGRAGFALVVATSFILYIAICHPLQHVSALKQSLCTTEALGTG